jgi:hypothetical protein
MQDDKFFFKICFSYNSSGFSFLAGQTSSASFIRTSYQKSFNNSGYCKINFIGDLQNINRFSGDYKPLLREDQVSIGHCQNWNLLQS